MHYFEYSNGNLCCEEVPLDRIAAEVGTPCYVYSQRTLQRHVQVFQDAFSSVPYLMCYAVKANSNLALLRQFASMGTGFDIVSGGELFRVLRSGAPADKVIFSGVGKTMEEIRYALDSNILFFAVESSAEADMIIQTARLAGKRARVSIRTNPDVDPRTHPYISTGKKKNKFGISVAEARILFERLRHVPEVEIVGISCHIGSQITDLGPYREALDGILAFVDELRGGGVPLRYLDFGGGLGITYNDEEPPSPACYASAIIEATKGKGLTLILEPGRVIVGNAGVLLARVVLRKGTDAKSFVVVDAAMNDLIRPALYSSFHRILPVRQTVDTEIADIVGPVCESADFLAQDRQVPWLDRGDLIAVMSAGAYGFVMSSNYNSRPRAAEVLVQGDRYEVVRRRETYEDLVKDEV